MKVKELKELLNKFDEEKEVLIERNGTGERYTDILSSIDSLGSGLIISSGKEDKNYVCIKQKDFEY